MGAADPRLIAPDTFIPIAEATGLITGIDAWGARGGVRAARQVADIGADRPLGRSERLPSGTFATPRTASASAPSWPPATSRLVRSSSRSPSA